MNPENVVVTKNYGTGYSVSCFKSRYEKGRRGYHYKKDALAEAKILLKLIKDGDEVSIGLWIAKNPN